MKFPILFFISICFTLSFNAPNHDDTFLPISLIAEYETVLLENQTQTKMFNIHTLPTKATAEELTTMYQYELIDYVKLVLPKDTLPIQLFLALQTLAVLLIFVSNQISNILDE